MNNESIPTAAIEQAGAVVDQANGEYVRQVSHSAELLTSALGLPRERRFEVLAALGEGVATALANLGRANDVEPKIGRTVASGEMPTR